MADPFSRVKALIAMASAFMQQGLEFDARNILGTYKSRGKGKNKSKPGKNYYKKPGKYMPHQGKHEVARRKRQREKREAKLKSS